MIFETNLLGTKCSVFEDRIVYQSLMGPTRVIPSKQIASVEGGYPGIQKIIIETTGGKKYKILVGLKEKQRLVDAIIQVISSK